MSFSSSVYLAYIDTNLILTAGQQYLSAPLIVTHVKQYQIMLLVNCNDCFRQVHFCKGLI